ncbi:MAG: hypothetical protein AMJ92_07710 [candidate division Zixibacteria bacterium SM23_81]|nr:MAG: hypothetical protein AMJ92_07710 [candidate division Zixibacteria bacterium SM23_81]
MLKSGNVNYHLGLSSIQRSFLDHLYDHGQGITEIGALRHGQIQISPFDTEGLLKDLTSQIGTCHGPGQGLGTAVGAHRHNQLTQARQVLKHDPCNVQPAQAVGDLRGLRLPDDVVSPDASKIRFCSISLKASAAAA